MGKIIKNAHEQVLNVYKHLAISLRQNDLVSHYMPHSILFANIYVF